MGISMHTAPVHLAAAVDAEAVDAEAEADAVVLGEYLQVLYLKNQILGKSQARRCKPFGACGNWNKYRNQEYRYHIYIN